MSVRPIFGPMHVTHIEHPEVVDRDHAAVKTLGYLETLVPYGSKDAGSKAVPRAVRNLNSLLHCVVLDDQPNRREHYKKVIPVAL